MNTRKVFAIISVVLFCLSLASCSKPPTEDEIKAAITDCSKENMSMFGIMGQNFNIESVVVKEIGDFDKKEKNYPVSAVVNVKYSIMGRDQTMAKPGKYKVSKNKQGKWVASQVNELMDAMGKALGL